MNDVAFFLLGITVATFGASALYFFKFWRESRDRFYFCFGLACALLALERLLAVFVPGTMDVLLTPAKIQGMWLYLLRLSAFASIFIGVRAKKNQT